MRTLAQAVIEYIAANETTKLYRETALNSCYAAINLELFGMTPQELKIARGVQDGTGVLFTSDELKLIGMIEEITLDFMDKGYQPIEAVIEALEHPGVILGKCVIAYK